MTFCILLHQTGLCVEWLGVLQRHESRLRLYVSVVISVIISGKLLGDFLFSNPIYQTSTLILCPSRTPSCRRCVMGHPDPSSQRVRCSVRGPPVGRASLVIMPLTFHSVHSRHKVERSNVFCAGWSAESPMLRCVCMKSAAESMSSAQMCSANSF